MEQPIKLQSLPGIKRDGTKLEGEHYIDGQWCRFQRGRPRKIGGYQSVTGALPELARGMDSFSLNAQQYLHIGHQSTLQQRTVNNDGQLTGNSDRTPGGFTISVNNLWQFSVFYEQVGAINHLIAHAGQNLAAIDSNVDTPIYFGQVDLGTPLASTGKSVSGGAVAIGPYLFAYGSSGLLSYSPVNDPAGTYTDAFITPQKIVKGLPIRGSGTGPAGIFWSLDSVIRATFVGGATVWDFDTLTSDTSILSSQGVIEYDGIFYWPGVDRFLMFNGVVRDVPNALNVNWFYDNLNFSQRQKVFAYKVPRFGEIWWCYPRGDAAECTHAVIYNVKEETWYDTELPDLGRTAGVYAKVYNKPFMADNELTGIGGYSLWQHETGTDRIEATDIQPIPSYFETAEISMVTAEQAMNKSLGCARIEPDFVQSGPMTVRVRGRSNSRAPIIEGETFTFPETASAPTEETVKTREVRRLMSFRFESNVAGGNYEMGEPIAHIEPADGRIES